MSEFQHPDWDGKLQPETQRAHWARLVSFVGVMVAFGGMTMSPAILSIGIGAMIMPAFIAFPLKVQLRRFWTHKPALFLSLLFFVHLLSGIWTRDTAAPIYLDLIKIKAPLFLSAYALAVLGPFPLRWIRLVLMLLLVTTFLTALGTVIDFAINREAINEAIQSSKEIKVWTGINHIYFSILCGFATLSTIWLVRFKVPALFRGEKILIAVLGSANFLFMHIMTTRTGLVGMYITLFVLGVIWVIQEKRYFLGVVAAIFLVMMPLVGYYSIGSFQRRLDNSIVDVTRYFSGKDPNYLSIGTRIESWKAAVHIFQDNPLKGVGMADMKEAMTAQYIKDESRLCPENFIPVHNQFLLNMAGYGVLGFVAFGLGWFYPLFQRRIPRSWLFWGFWILATASMMGESILERQVGINFVTVVFMLSLGTGVSWPGQDKSAWR